jgi:hypothetical protein
VLDVTAFDKDGNKVEIDMKLVNDWIDPNTYKSKRVIEYPSIGDQLDDLYHAGLFTDEMAARIEAVKTKYPKG